MIELDTVAWQSAPDRPSQYAILRTLLMRTASHTGEAFLHAAVKALADVMGAEFAFVTRLAEGRTDRVDMLAALRGNAHIEGWSFDLADTPCEMVYASPADTGIGGRHGAGVVMPDYVNQRFGSTRSTDYRAFVGVPLWSERDLMIGHLALFFRRALDHDEEALLLELTELFCLKLQSELHRMLLERSRMQLLAELEQANARLERESTTDATTGLFNRRLFDQRLREARACLDRNGTPYGLLLVDLDYLKRINDAHGHPAGDVALTAVASALLGCTRRDVETVCRIGGDEFAVLCIGTAEPAVLQQLAARINQAVRTLDAAPLSLTVSVGGASARRDADDLYERADAALYRAKSGGRDCTVIA